MTAQGMETREGQDPAEGLGAKHDSPVGNADAPKGGPMTSPTSSIEVSEEMIEAGIRSIRAHAGAFGFDTCLLERDELEDMAEHIYRVMKAKESLPQGDVRLRNAAKALIDDVRARYPGEELRCPHMIELDAAITAIGSQSV